jgi:hypothetical protein
MMLKRVSSSRSFQRSKVEFAIKGIRDAFDNARAHWDDQMMDVSMSQRRRTVWSQHNEKQEAVDGSNKGCLIKNTGVHANPGGEQVAYGFTSALAVVNSDVGNAMFSQHDA